VINKLKINAWSKRLRFLTKHIFLFLITNKALIKMKAVNNYLDYTTMHGLGRVKNTPYKVRCTLFGLHVLFLATQGYQKDCSRYYFNDAIRCNNITISTFLFLRVSHVMSECCYNYVIAEYECKCVTCSYLLKLISLRFHWVPAWHPSAF